MTKPASKPRVALLGTAAAVLVAGAVAWFIVDRSSTPSSAPASATAASAAGARPAPKTLDKPLWRDLTPAQQRALAPLQAEWDQLGGLRKRRWLELSQRFSSMSPTEQQRVHERMREWMKLTPEQRNLARENFSKARSLSPGDKAATWESYKQLSEEQKRKLAKSARKPAPVALPESPTLIAPTSCPPNTTRRGASCITLPGAEPAPATAASPGASPALPGAPAPNAPASSAPASGVPASGAHSAPAMPSAPPSIPPSPQNASN
ncbi:hypothetical protein B0920_00915 [Massilia sp. KIM]|uniref:DUF3106 domain-containing protein n=1 Tax=Massilia sp. KIM TaxID=1955422 RepID=UPI00098EBC18|nr:DUF3106 domain-containing protein [Massilia sp. KIM]OON62087.1 hypothetical protein B0920_00915 [Massilia sp. KIM]